MFSSYLYEYNFFVDSYLSMEQQFAVYMPFSLSSGASLAQLPVDVTDLRKGTIAYQGTAVKCEFMCNCMQIKI